MRVIAGRARRAVLKTVPGNRTRPTTDRIKETLFNIVNPILPGCSFLDLFCGSGGIGIEALSRGAKKAVFVDNSQQAVDCVNENLIISKLSDEDVSVLRADAVTAIKKLGSKGIVFDIVYMDPPYSLKAEEDVLKALSDLGLVNEDSLVIIEADKNNKLDFISQTAFEITREKDYKTNKHFFLRLKNAERT